MARALLYHTLLEYAEGSRKIADLSVVTGQGHGSGSHGPVLPAATRGFLQEPCLGNTAGGDAGQIYVQRLARATEPIGAG